MSRDSKHRVHPQIWLWVLFLLVTAGLLGPGDLYAGTPAARSQQIAGAPLPSHNDVTQTAFPEGQANPAQEICAHKQRHKGDITVPPGKTCTLIDSWVGGNIKVRRGGHLIVLGTMIEGNVQTYDAASIRLGCNPGDPRGCAAAQTTVKGNVHINGTTGTPSGFVANTICDGTVIDGNLQLQSNKSPFVVGGAFCAGIPGGGNRVDGNLDVLKNKAAINIANNNIDGNLKCISNQPQPTGSNNQVDGNTLQQCRRLTDELPPSLVATVTPPPNAQGWHKTDVTVSFAATDGVSGVATVTPAVLVTTEAAGQIITGTATDFAGNTAGVEVTVNLDKTIPDLAITYPAAGAVVATPELSVQGTAAESLSGLHTLFCNGEPASLSGAAFTCAVSLLEGENEINVRAADLAGNEAARSLIVTYFPAGGLPPDPAAVAPALDRTIATTMAAATAFLYTGQNPIQTGVQPGTIVEHRVAVIRGRVLTRDQEPLSGVTMTILAHPEFGGTLSRADGMFDIAVNGGGLLTVEYKKEGFLPAQRQLYVPWAEYAWLDDVVLLPLDSSVTSIDLSSPAAIQVAQGSVVSDADGARQATVMIPQGVAAELLLPDGTTQPLPSLHLRATEYTVGDLGPQAMPAELQCQAAYTYAVELSADEAMAAGASQVVFSEPLYFYLENFLDFPVGGIVPSAYYDRRQGAWIPTPNGRIIAILAISGGLAEVDTDGDGLADDGLDLGLTAAERQQLAARYVAGQSLWRVPVQHFTPLDLNWPAAAPDDAQSPNQEDPSIRYVENCRGPEASIIECESQTLREEMPITGTPFTLYYGSDRVPGRAAGRTLHIPLSGAGLPASLKRIELEVNVAGRRFLQTYPAAPDQTATFTWDGLDAYGRLLQGRQPITTSIAYVYDGTYVEPAAGGQSFGSSSGLPIPASQARQEVPLVQQWQGAIGTWDAAATGLGGWTFDVHHTYDVAAGVIFLGDGGERAVADLAGITTVAGTGNAADSGDGGSAAEAAIDFPRGITVGPDNSLYVATNGHRVRRVDPDGVITTIAGTGTPGFSGDGGPAAQAALNRPWDVAVGPDGSLYIADYFNRRVRRVGPDGIITTVAGNGERFVFLGDGGPATEANLAPVAVAVGPDNALYISDVDNNRIRRVAPDGIITTIAGNGEYGDGWGDVGDGGPATQANLAFPLGIAISSCCDLYVADSEVSRLRRVGPDGIITTVAGTGFPPDFSGDGGPATQASLYLPNDVAVGLNDQLYLADAGNPNLGGNNRIRRVRSDGIINTAVGIGFPLGFGGDGGPAPRAMLNYPGAIAFGPDNGLYIADTGNNRIRRVGPPSSATTAGEIILPSADGQQIYIFDPTGRHLRTLHSLTGAVLFEFAYDANGYLSEISDGDGNTTTIERDAAGQPTAVIAPFGQRTQLSLDANGRLRAITNPALETAGFSYSPAGLMTGMTYPAGGTSTFDYDAHGRLTRDEDPRGGAKTLSRSEDGDGYTVTLTSAEGRQTAYSVQFNALDQIDRRVTHADGTQARMTVGTDGGTLIELPDGTVIDLLEGPDPRFGMQAALPSSYTVTSPGGLVSTTGTERSVVLANPDDSLSLTSQTDQLTVNGRLYTSHYDAASRTFTETSPAGRVRTRTIDDQGRVTRDQIAGLEPLVFTYDVHGRLENITQGSGAGARTYQLTYNAGGFLESIVDPLNRMVQFLYDAVGRITEQTQPDGSVIAFGYDENGNTTRLTPPGRSAHTFAYNDVNLQEAYNPPDVGLPQDETFSTYDLDRQLTRIALPAGQNLNFAYNAVTGQLTTLTFSRGDLTYTYAAGTGLPATIGAPAGVSLAFNYDGSLLTQESWSGPVPGNVAWTYDDDFRIAGISVNGDAIPYQVDADGLLTGAGALAMTRGADNGLLAGTVLGTVLDSWSYSNFGEPSGYTATVGGSAIYDLQLTRDKLGRIAGMDETIGGVTDSYAYTYDLAGRLQAVQKNGVPIAGYTYDSNGNRLTATGQGTTVAGTYDDQDRLAQYGDTAYTYTADGRLLSRSVAGQTTNYQIDELGNLVSVAPPGGPQIAYLIDGRDRRVGRLVNGTLVQGWLYQDGLNPIAELNNAGNVVSRFVYGTRAWVPDYMTKGGVTYRIIADHLGSPRLVIDTSTGAVAQRLDYDAFGRILFDSNPGFQPFGFAGGLYDNATGLLRFGARDYDPQTGRWLSKDSVWDVISDANLYTYVDNDPLNRIDPQGRQSVYTYSYCNQPAQQELVDRAIDWAKKAAVFLFGRAPERGVPTAASNIRG